jgi:hypothetical protein
MYQVFLIIFPLCVKEQLINLSKGLYRGSINTCLVQFAMKTCQILSVPLYM